VNSLHAHALAYARAGLPVLPLVPREKRPHGLLAPHGKDDATTDLEQIDMWWKRCPDANVGVRPPIGNVVVDVDPRHGGHLELRKLTTDYGALPLTWQADTGSNGMHLWFHATGDFRAELRPGIDLKDHRGYLVMPPSIHPNGRRYEWATDAPIARAPGWLVTQLRKPARQTRPAPAVRHTGKGEPLLRFVASAQEGNRNAALFWAACRAVADGILDEIHAELVAVARGIGLPEREIESTIASAIGRAA
jgi:hypothetical protein